MNGKGSAYTIFFFGKPMSFSHEAALCARRKVCGYLEKTQGLSLMPDDINPKSVATQDELKGLIKGYRDAFFVVPISSSKLGDVYDFMPFYSYQMIDEVALEVVFVLCNLSGNPHDVRYIITKNTAYQQVIDALAARGFDLDNVGRPDNRSTSEAAEKASNDRTIAAICSPKACEQYGLNQIGDILDQYVTTFGIFFNEPRPHRITGRAQGQFPLLLRHANLYTGRVPHGGKIEFVELLNSKDRLRVKWGIDPISKEMHLGHLACLYKLQQFLAFDHEVVVVLGTYTGQVGDPSGNLTARPRLDQAELESNAELIRAQIEGVLGSGKAKIEYNTKLMEGLDLGDLLRWGYAIDYRLLLERSDFKQRLKSDRSLSLAEMLYGLLQAHDSLVLDIDVEVGGIDQLHNCILMRDIFRLEKRDPPFSLLIPLVPGIDGDAKMSTFRKNEIVVTDCEKRIRSRILSIRRPDHIFEYLRMLSDVEEETVSEWEMGFANGNISINKLSQWMADAVLKKMEPWLEPVKSN